MWRLKPYRFGGEAPMAAIHAVLKDLQGLRADLADVRQQLQRAPAQLRVKENDLAKKREALLAKKEELRQSRMAIDRKELALKSDEQRVSDLQVKINMCKSPREFTLLQEESKRLAALNAQVEDEVLHMLQDHENAQQAFDAQSNAFAADEADCAKFKELVDYKVKKANDQVLLLEQAIEEKEKSLDIGTRNDLRRLIKNKGENALAECSNGACSACFTTQTTQQMNDLQMGRVVYCLSCGAMLYKV